MRKRFFCFAFLLFLGGPLLGAGSFSLQQIMNSPFPSGMVSSRSGEKVAWVVNFQGARNIWMAEAPDFRGRQVTEWAADDGLTLSALEWSGDGKLLVFVRGDGQNRQGELPNPTHDSEGVKQQVWLFELETGKARSLAEGSNPVFGPEGKVLFLRRGQIWAIETSEGAEAKQLLQARGQAGGLKMSPDGTRLLFASSRGDHGFIGVFNFTDREARFLDPSVDRDTAPVWAPDGQKVAYLRIPATSRRYIFAPRREGEPWSIRVTELATGQSREVWRAQPGAGSVFWPVEGDNPLLWSSDGNLVFPWERDGWAHLYSVAERGGSARLLTPGNFEVEFAAVSNDGLSVVYHSNQDDIDRRHIWTVPASGSELPTALTSGTSNQWAPAPAVGGAVAFIGASGTSPAQPYVRLSGGQIQPLAPTSLPPDFPEADLVEPQQVIIAAADGMKIHGQLFLPRDRVAGRKYPAMLYFHGGSRRQMLLGWHYSSYYHNCYAMNQYLANQGYVVLSVNYRSGIGYGMEFREAENYGATGASEFNDVLGAGLYLRGREDVDPNRIGLWGGSYGGYLTALGLSRASDLFAAGVDVHGVHDWNVVIKNFVPSYNPLEDPEAARLAFESSPMASVSTWKSPVLLIHGDDDRNVPFSESVDLAESLRKQGVEFEQVIFPDEIHGFLLYRSWLTAFERAADFVQRHLGGSR